MGNENFAPRRSRKGVPLPESFLFGVATSDHQCEAYDVQREDVRDVWDRELRHTPRGRASDFGVRYPEDITLARELGCRIFRLSIAWSRVEPSAGVFDSDAFAHYARVLQTIRAAGMEPLVTLHHFTWPIHIEAAGGMIAEHFPSLYTRYVAEVVARLGNAIRYWVTFNEPSQLVFGYIKPWWESDYPMPPGLPQGASFDDQAIAIAKLIHNLFTAHSEARAIIKNAFPNAMVGTNPLLLGLPVWLQRWIDKRATKVTNTKKLAKHARRISARLGRELGKVDVVLATLTRTRERERSVLFSDPYFVASQTLLVRAESGTTGVRDLYGKVLAVVNGSTAQTYAAHHLLNSMCLPLKDYTACLQSLESGKADALLADDTIVQHFMQARAGLFRIAEGNLIPEPYAAAVALGNQDTLDLVNSVIHDFTPSDEWKVRYPHFADRLSLTQTRRTVAFLDHVGGNDRPLDHAAAGPAEPLPLAKRGTAVRRIQQRGYLVVAIKEDVPGFGTAEGKEGTPAGLEVELAHALAKRIFGDPTRVRFQAATTENRIPLLRSIFHFVETIRKDLSILSVGFSSNWWYLGMAGRLPEYLCPKKCAGQLDFIGVDYYWGIPAFRLDRIRRLIEAAAGHFDQAPVWPRGLYGHLRYHARLLPRLPLLVVENGSVPMTDGVDRGSYIRRHVEQVQRAQRDGINVIGYVCWSITSNREWGLPFGEGSDFGLYHIDLDNDTDLKRQETPSVPAFRAIIKNRGIGALP
jgi:beta-glucosidase/6-phospho-beta-glucosidase/beta-galactosidase/ABC-type amino acid transport substrate-binding protein